METPYDLFNVGPQAHVSDEEADALQKDVERIGHFRFRFKGATRSQLFGVIQVLVQCLIENGLAESEPEEDLTPEKTPAALESDPVAFTDSDEPTVDFPGPRSS